MSPESAPRNVITDWIMNTKEANRVTPQRIFMATLRAAHHSAIICLGFLYYAAAEKRGIGLMPEQASAPPFIATQWQIYKNLSIYNNFYKIFDKFLSRIGIIFQPTGSAL